MEFLKCNLYIVGNRRAGKSFFKRILEEFIHFERKTPADKLNGPDWIIRTHRIHIEVEIKEYNKLNLQNSFFDSDETTNIILYIVDGNEYKSDFFIPSEDIKVLKTLSTKAKVVVSPTFRPYEFDKNFNINPLKKIIPFVEYFLPIYDLYFRDYEGVSQVAYVLRRLIIQFSYFFLKID